MKAELQKKLFKKYPKIFKDVGEKPNVTVIYFGIETGDGWYQLIDDLCHRIQKYIDDNDKKQSIAIQIKEKFGALRFYCYNGDDVIFDMIDAAEKDSMEICESCSKPGIMRNDGWMKVRCDPCFLKGM